MIILYDSSVSTRQGLRPCRFQRGPAREQCQWGGPSRADSPEDEQEGQEEEEK